MPPLICSFASHRSHPDRIRSWIHHLEQLANAHAQDEDFARTVSILLQRARSWLPESSAPASAER